MPGEPTSDAGWKKLAGIGFELAAAVAGFVLLGYFWDRHFGSSPWWVLTGAVLGLIGGMYNMIRQSLLATRQSSRGTDKTDDGAR
jgi:F0F1-type ATP synthase assembly protein I